MTNRWTISHGQDGFQVQLYRYGWRQVAAQTVETVFDRGCRFTGHMLCCSGPEWAWKIPVGKARYDVSVPDEPWLENSVASVCNDMFNRVSQWGYRITEPTKITELAVSDEVGNQVWPEYAEMWGEDEDDK